MIEDLLLQNRKAIIDRWIQSITTTYPKETSHFLQFQKDQFSNPVGHIISESAKDIFDEISKGFDSEKIKSILDYVVKVRAVQNFSPSEAIGFIFYLKQALYEEIEFDIHNEEAYEDLTEIESRIDKTALIAFDLYIEAREKIYQLRINEIKSKMVQNAMDNNRTAE